MRLFSVAVGHKILTAVASLAQRGLQGPQVSAAVTHGLSCSMERGIFFPRWGIKPLSAALVGRVKPKCLQSPVQSPRATILTTLHSTPVTLASFHFLKHFTNSHIKTFVHVLLCAWDALHLDFQRVCSSTPASGLSTHHLLSEICLYTLLKTITNSLHNTHK